MLRLKRRYRLARRAWRHAVSFRWVLVGWMLSARLAPLQGPRIPLSVVVSRELQRCLPELEAALFRPNPLFTRLNRA